MNKALQPVDRFIERHIGPNEADKQKMLEVIGEESMEALIGKVIPEDIRLEEPMDIPSPQTEAEFLSSFKKLAEKNQIFKSYIGLGYHDCHTPPVILRNLLENPGWYTQYTPYQAEISQGRLESLLNFQTLITDLTKLEMANASLLDEATAAAEAMHLMHAARARDLKKAGANVLFVSDQVFPQTIDVLKTRAEPLNIEIRIGDHRTLELGDDWDDMIFGVILQYPTLNGTLYDYRALCDKIHEKNAMVTVAADLFSLLLLTPPGEFGADIAVGSAQRFGVPLGFGGPHAAYFATSEKHKRLIPGRIIGVSVDRHGKPAYRMALQTREQHIKRDKATSNICTAQALLANISAMYAVYHGPKRLKAIAERIHAHTILLAEGLKRLAYPVTNEQFFDTIETRVEKIAPFEREALRAGINFRYDRETSAIGIALDETTEKEDVQSILDIFAKLSASEISVDEIIESGVSLELNVGDEFKRSSTYLEHPVFNTYHSETDMLRYLKQLENKDLSLAHSMIPLGSCTMKLNATAEMIPVTWKEFGGIHPFVPLNQIDGYMEMFRLLNDALCEATGFDEMSLQPNAGAQGEYSGLLAIRGYLRDKGEGHRNIAIIPSSAHGTNPASAVMAGMKVVVVKCDEQGNIDLEDLRAKVEQHSENLAALMVTYPSTHGVFEVAIREICALIHEHGGQVYMDGANMNAQVGLTSPAIIGADVCHLNLHKTFCIPHGGGGPGMGPIGVKKHLAPFLPGHVTLRDSGSANAQETAVSAAPWGSASILTISWAYIAMMGEAGLTEATKVSILSANYILARLKGHYDVLYTGHNGYAAHEMILDLRKFKQSAGIEAEDIAKRLMDYGFHAPTLSFPVPGTVMVEPTESEPLHELDRFCDAMIAIREEIRAVEEGTADKEDNVLKNAPHTQEAVIADEWEHAYSRSEAAYPVESLRSNKFWATVGRVNNTQGDRILICTCPAVEEYAEEAAV